MPKFVMSQLTFFSFDKYSKQIKVKLINEVNDKSKYTCYD